jgi:hypothetical protein
MRRVPQEADDRPDGIPDFPGLVQVDVMVAWYRDHGHNVRQGTHKLVCQGQADVTIVGSMEQIPRKDDQPTAPAHDLTAQILVQFCRNFAVFLDIQGRLVRYVDVADVIQVHFEEESHGSTAISSFRMSRGRSE